MFSYQLPKASLKKILVSLKYTVQIFSTFIVDLACTDKQFTIIMYGETVSNNNCSCTYVLVRLLGNFLWFVASERKLFYL